jgi:hypothetical protein
MAIVFTSSPNVSCNEYATVTRSELAHDFISFLLIHVAVHAGNSKVVLSHLIRKPLNFVSLVAENDGLGDGQSIIEIAKSVEFPLLLIDLNEELLDSFQCQLITLHQNLYWVFHELLSHVQYFLGHGC